MKKFTLVLSVLMLCTMMNAQQQVATLIHDGNIRIFYGENAFIDANDAAVSGDAISLSAGIFKSANITKNLTIRGAGWKSQAYGTHFINAIRIRIPQSDTVSHLSIEGIDFRDVFYVDSVLNSPTIVKCYLNHMAFNKSFNGMVVSSIINNYDSSVNNYAIQTTFINSIVDIGSQRNISACAFYNCIIASVFNNILASTLESSIILSYFSGYSLPNTNVVSNCVSNFAVFNNFPDLNNSVVKLSDLFVTMPVVSNSSPVISNKRQYSFELTDSAKTTYVDANGSQVGIYGGAYPFTDKLNYPTITRMQVGKKATADGKLSVDIEVTPGE